MEQNTNELYQAAIKYIKKGIPVFPCWSKTKKPIPEHGFHDATTMPNQIDLWWQRTPNADIAMPTGNPSGILVLDVDPRHGGDYSLQELISQYGKLLDTVQSFTGGGGQHYYFKHPGNVGCSSGKIASGIDIKGDGGYVMLPPSSHESGNKYSFELSSDIADVPLAECPEWLIKMARDDSKENPNKYKPDSSPIPEGYRNSTMASLAGHLRSLGMEAPIIYEALSDINSRRCVPPLDDKEIKKIAHSISRYEPSQARQAVIENWDGQLKDLAKFGQPDICPISSFETKEINWLWPKRVPIGKLTVLAGDPGLGKSFVSLDIAARVSSGQPWPDSPDIRPEVGSVILLSAEDDPADTIKPRLEQMNADCNRIHILRAVNMGDGKQKYFDLTTDMQVLKNAITSIRDCRLVIIDPISAYLGKADGHSNTEIRGLLAPLADIAASYQVAMLAVTHLNKGGGSNPLYRAMGSLAFVAAARVVWIITRDNDDGEIESPRRLMLPAKNNIAEDDSGMSYMIVNNSVMWEDSTVEMTAGKFFREQFENETKTKKKSSA
ncbi:MAG: bifunctional DNA primase/polymerase [Phycisphaerales bacterium]